MVCGSAAGRLACHASSNGAAPPTTADGNGGLGRIVRAGLGLIWGGRRLGRSPHFGQPMDPLCLVGRRPQKMDGRFRVASRAGVRGWIETDRAHCFRAPAYIPQLEQVK